MNATNLITLADASALLPRRRGKKTHVKTLARWIIKGCRGNKLSATKLGGVWFTSEKWLLDFQTACSQHATSDCQANEVTGIASASQQMARRILMQRYGFHAKEETNSAQVPHL